jgi:protein-tyrosine-phosphatase
MTMSIQEYSPERSQESRKPMKVLFICYANVGRSQVAEAWFKMLSSHECESAGIAVNDRIAAMKLASKKLKDNPKQSSVQYIRRELGVDIGKKKGDNSSLK